MFDKIIPVIKTYKNAAIKIIISTKAISINVIPIQPSILPALANPFPLYFSGFWSIFFLPALLKITAAIQPRPPISGIGVKPSIPKIKLSKLNGSSFLFKTLLSFTLLIFSSLE